MKLTGVKEELDKWYNEVQKYNIIWNSEMLDTRKEAIDVSIEKANELRNEVLNK